jgi:hypothetical protein
MPGPSHTFYIIFCILEAGTQAFYYPSAFAEAKFAYYNCRACKVTIIICTNLLKSVITLKIFIFLFVKYLMSPVLFCSHFEEIFFCRGWNFYFEMAGSLGDRTLQQCPLNHAD